MKKVEQLQKKNQHLILDPIQITVNNSYNIVDWEKALIKKCIHDNPSSVGTEIAKMLGWAERTLYRKMVAYNIESLRNKIKA